jgi:hypothetical protein
MAQRIPHTPFLLDAFQAALSADCSERHGFPPLTSALVRQGSATMHPPRDLCADVFGRAEPVLTR